MQIQSLTKRFPNAEATPQIETAAPVGAGNGGKTASDKTRGKNTDDRLDTQEGRLATEADCRALHVSDGVKRFRLASGFTLEVECDETGLIAARDFELASGAVIRFERRIVQLVPPLTYGGAV